MIYDFINFLLGGQRLYDSAVLHTSLGDITLKLFPKECPKTVENFCVHAKGGFYNGHVFHRVIKQFMIQTGDPLGRKATFSYFSIICLKSFSFLIKIYYLLELSKFFIL